MKKHACVAEDPTAAMCWRALCSINSFTMRSFRRSTVQILHSSSARTSVSHHGQFYPRLDAPVAGEAVQQSTADLHLSTLLGP